MSGLTPIADIFEVVAKSPCLTHSGHRLDILNTLFLSAYLYQSIFEVLRLFAKFHE
jgi:hypothetical protein